MSSDPFSTRRFNRFHGRVESDRPCAVEGCTQPGEFRAPAAEGRRSGHDGSGESHFTVDIVADRFTGQTRVARQRLVNAALADLLRDKVHALAIKARAPGEA